MTEQEYIDTTDMQRLRDAQSILSNIVPENSKVIDPVEYRFVFNTIRSWCRQLENNISTKE